MLPDTKAACSSRIGRSARRFESWGWVFWRAETSQKHQGVSQPAWAEQSLVLGVFGQIPAGGRARAGWKCLSAHPHPPLTTHGGAAALLTTPAGLELWVCSSLRAGRSCSRTGQGGKFPSGISLQSEQVQTPSQHSGTSLEHPSSPPHGSAARPDTPFCSRNLQPFPIPRDKGH